MQQLFVYGQLHYFDQIYTGTEFSSDTDWHLIKLNVIPFGNRSVGYE
jgi:hypothetical protein